jgi:cobyrinic acid a,c-diamide synthase
VHGDAAVHGAWRKPRGCRRRQPPHAGLLSHATSFAHPKLHLGYREARLGDSLLGNAGARLRGHEFHYAALVETGDDEPFVELADGQGESLGTAGGRRGQVTGTFFHAIAKKKRMTGT